jgi:putative membrane protein insertion efficiency factor
VRLSWIKNSVYNLRYIPIELIDIYQNIISPFTSPTCRFYPSCSMYARLAIKKYGITKGGIMSLIRFTKCQPFHPGGYDPLD